MSEKELEQKVEVADKELEGVSGGEFRVLGDKMRVKLENDAIIDGAVPAKLDDK